MPEAIRKKAKVEVAQNPPKEEKEPQKETNGEVPEEKLPLWNFPLKGRSVKAKNLQEAIKKVNTKE